MSTTEEISISANEGEAAGDPTFVEGVGNIPRDIYKHVQSDPLGDLPR